MSVRAKFTVQSIERQKHWDRTKGEIQTIKLIAVSDGSEENKAFFAVTPTASISLGTVNEEAAKQFELGESYYVDFTKA